MKKILFIFLLLGAKMYCQKYTVPELHKVTIDNVDKNRMDAALDYNTKALKFFQEENNKEGIISAYTNIGNLLSTMNMHEESLYYLDKVKDELGNDKDPIMNTRLYYEYGRNYSTLGLFKQSNENLDKALKFAKNIKESKRKTFYTYYSYSWKWNNFDMMNEVDSVYSMQKKSARIMQSSLAYTRIAERFMREKKHLDSAEIYLNKAIALTAHENDERATVYLYFGDLYLEKNDYNKALEYYSRALIIYERFKRKINIATVYEKISNAYKGLHDIEKTNEYLEKHKLVNDSIKTSEKKSINIILQNLLKEKEKEEKEKRRNLYIMIIGIITASFFAIYYIIKLYKRTQQKKDIIIQEKLKETESLRKKIGISFDEVMTLAKSRDPFFLTRFKEAYPDFFDSLMEANSNLSQGDVRLCAYLRLDLTSKEIAIFDNITLRSVDTKKYRLKKKLNLSTEEDLAKWIADL
ncbi:tetratricopeptide repeat protein [Chryseobacterium polytrichastri]|uniref:Tetratricopeptide repeat-containing protein n=1 Tax=Chryseobacterium polytrichastri TaxID=1302687 RepID=A0A1M6Y7Z6_9FLAO|nr:tetratricopeptide repeat protein [Chryseobacterium polytrichastri]SHL14159.1 Tetratricopeptide repeat-containing protein [Chryseobacterium polytrichastri]